MSNVVQMANENFQVWKSTLLGRQKKKIYHEEREINEPHREKTGFLPRRKQRRRSASRGNREADQRLCFRYSDSIIPLLLIAKISSI